MQNPVRSMAHESGCRLIWLVRRGARRIWRAWDAPLQALHSSLGLRRSAALHIYTQETTPGRAVLVHIFTSERMITSTTLVKSVPYVL